MHTGDVLIAASRNERAQGLRKFRRPLQGSLAVGSALVLMAGAACAETIEVGVTPGPHATILEKVREIAAAEGLDIQMREFSDYVGPNQALDNGELHANSFQHKPYMDDQVAERGFDIIDVASTVNFPMGIYSKRYDGFEALPDGATIGIPNDPANGGRALLILADKGQITVDAAKGLRVTVADVLENPRKYRFVEVDAAELPRSLDEMDAAAINSNFAIEAGLDPATDPILSEGAKAPYVNVIAVRGADRDAPWVRQLVDAYHTYEVKQFVLETFKGAVIPAW